LIHFAHSARADLSDDFVGAEFGVGLQAHGCFPVGTRRFNSSNQFCTT
jgi:hypothetical protein